MAFPWTKMKKIDRRQVSHLLDTPPAGANLYFTLYLKQAGKDTPET